MVPDKDPEPQTSEDTKDSESDDRVTELETQLAEKERTIEQFEETVADLSSEVSELQQRREDTPIPTQSSAVSHIAYTALRIFLFVVVAFLFGIGILALLVYGSGGAFTFGLV